MDPLTYAMAANMTLIAIPISSIDAHCYYIGTERLGIEFCSPVPSLRTVLGLVSWIVIFLVVAHLVFEERLLYLWERTRRSILAACSYDASKVELLVIQLPVRPREFCVIPLTSALLDRLTTFRMSVVDPTSGKDLVMPCTLLLNDHAPPRHVAPLAKLCFPPEWRALAAQIFRSYKPRLKSVTVYVLTLANMVNAYTRFHAMRPSDWLYGYSYQDPTAAGEADATTEAAEGPKAGPDYHYDQGGRYERRSPRRRASRRKQRRSCEYKCTVAAGEININ